MAAIMIQDRWITVDNTMDEVVTAIKSGASVSSHNMIQLTCQGRIWYFNAQAIDAVKP
jgi:hypothetical protein